MTFNFYFEFLIDDKLIILMPLCVPTEKKEKNSLMNLIKFS